MKPGKRFLCIGFMFCIAGFIGSAYGDENIIHLPEVSRSGTISVEQALYTRESVRKFRDEPLPMTHLSQLLWAACGKNVDGVSGPTRTGPSAGGLYPVEAYAIVGKVDQISPGIYSYNWRNHTIRLVKSGDYRAAVAQAALHQRFIGDAPLIILLTAEYEKTTVKYGMRGSTRYVPMDAGHAAQNVFLQAVALDLGTVTIGAFYDQKVKEIAGLTGEEPLCIMPVGKARL